MPAKYSLSFDPFGNPKIEAVIVERTPNNQPVYRQGWAIDTIDDLNDLKEKFANDATPLALLNGIDESTLEPSLNPGDANPS